MNPAPPTSPRRRLPSPPTLAFLAVLALAAGLRLYDLKDVPAGLFCDEAAFGYNGFSISRGGYDENGAFLPLLVWSFAGYKNTIYIYSTALATWLFGLDEFSTRLPAAIFGLGSIWALFALGRALFHPWVGVFAALFLAVAPWHLHFSRIAFEMTPFAFLFSVAALFLVRYTQGRRTLPLAAFFCSLCPYNYAISTVFLPLFLGGFALLYLPTLLRRWKESLLAIAVGVGTLLPLVRFYQMHPQGRAYTRNTMWFDLSAPLEPQLRQLGTYWLEFFSQRFLFESGDPLTRHSVREFGELLPIFLPFLLLGGVAALLRRERFSKLILWWLAIYPIGAALLTEIPSATRAFIGVPAFALLAGLGLGTGLWILGKFPWRPLAVLLQAGALGATLWFLVPQTADYVRFYLQEYPKYSAPTYGGFQFGYRESFEIMEPLRDKYSRLMITATEVNQPQIFPLFYNAVDPAQYRVKRDIGYLIADPSFYSEYKVDSPVLYQLRESDLAYFSDYTVLREIVAPGGQKEFVIAEVRKRRQFLDRWLALGLFDNADGTGMKTDFIDVQKITKDRVRGAFGEVYWRPLSQRTVRVDLNAGFAGADPRNIGNPENVCAYTLTTIRRETPVEAVLEMGGSGDPGKIWLNGVPLTPWAVSLGPAVARYPVTLGAGNNLLVVKGCEGIGDWYFVARLTDEEGNDLPGITAEAVIPGSVVEAKAPPLPTGDFQAVEGFDKILRFRHTDARYADYRGGTESWWAYVRDGEGDVVWQTATVPEARTVVAVLTVSFSEVAFDGELFVNGRFALPFSLSEESRSQTWTEGNHRMTFIHRGDLAGRSGLLLVEVPKEAVVAGSPLELRLAPTGGHDGGWVMVKGYPDTLTHEALTPDLIAGLTASVR